MNRTTEILLFDASGRERARHRLPYGAKLLVDEGAQVTRSQRLAEWDPYTLPIITEREGVANYVDLGEGVSIREEIGREWCRGRGCQYAWNSVGAVACKTKDCRHYDTSSAERTGS